MSPETWLSIDLSSRIGTMALHSLNDSLVPILIQEITVGGRSAHSENLILKLKSFLGQNRIELSRISRYITSSGPGSFTGIRIAFSTIKAFALSMKSTIEVVDGAEARALAWFQRNNYSGRRVIIVTQVGTDRFVKDTYEVGGSELFHLFHQRISAAELFSKAWYKDRDFYLMDQCERDISRINFQVFPLTASHLGDTLFFCKTRKSYSEYSSWLTLSPRYDGEEWRSTDGRLLNN